MWQRGTCGTRLSITLIVSFETRFLGCDQLLSQIGIVGSMANLHQWCSDRQRCQSARLPIVLSACLFGFIVHWNQSRPIQSGLLVLRVAPSHITISVLDPQISSDETGIVRGQGCQLMSIPQALCSIVFVFRSSLVSGSLLSGPLLSGSQLANCWLLCATAVCCRMLSPCVCIQCLSQTICVPPRVCASSGWALGNANVFKFCLR